MKNKLQNYLIVSGIGFLSAMAGTVFMLQLAGYPLATAAADHSLRANLEMETDAVFLAKRTGIVNVAAYDVTTERELSALSLQDAFNNVAKQAIPGVVSIRVTTKVNGGGGGHNQRYRQFFGDDFFERFFKQQPGAPERELTSSGSGFLIDKAGYLISNYHVIKDATAIKVFFSDAKKEYAAEVVGVDPDTDLALLKIVAKNIDFPFLPLGNSDLVETGDIVIAIGNPFGLSHTFTTGVISAKGRTGIANRYENFIQTDTVINPGNSGGPLLNLNGEVIGINSNILSQTQSSIGLGFSIPVNMAKTVVAELRATGRVVRGWLGIYYEDMSKDVADALGAPNSGIIIQRVVEASPAAKAGLAAGDIITEFNRRVLRNGKDLLYQISKVKVGTTIPIKLLRDGQTLTIRVRLDAQNQQAITASDPAPPRDEPATKIRSITVREMNSAELKTYRSAKPFGVVITEIDESSPLNYYGISNGDIIVAVNKQPTPSIAAFKKILNNTDKNKKLLFQIRSGASIYYIVSTL